MPEAPNVEAAVSGPTRRWPSLVVVAVVIAADYWVVTPQGIHTQWLRLMLTMAAFALVHGALGPATLDLGLRRIRPALRVVGMVVAIGAAVYLVAAAAVLVATHWGGLRWPLQPANFHHPSQYLPWLALAVGWAPITEELVYRGIVQARLQAISGRWTAIAISGLSFWIYHWVSFGRITSPHHLGAGLLLAWSFQRARSLWAPMLLHALGNFVLGTSDLIYVLYPQWVHTVLGWT